MRDFFLGVTIAATFRCGIPEAAPTPEERPRAADKPVRGTLSTERAERELGFKARWPLEQGYKRYCEWYAAEWERAKQALARA